jgi:hypothetical protein
VVVAAGRKRQRQHHVGNGCYVDLAYGDATNKVIIRRQYFLSDTGPKRWPNAFGTNLLFDSYKPVPAGATLYVRGRCSTTPDSNWNAVAIGIGG